MNDCIESSSEELKLGKGKWPVKDVEPAGQRSMCDTQRNTCRVLSATTHGEQTSACQETGSARFWMTTNQQEMYATNLSETTNAFYSGRSVITLILQKWLTQKWNLSLFHVIPNPYVVIVSCETQSLRRSVPLQCSSSAFLSCLQII